MVLVASKHQLASATSDGGTKTDGIVSVTTATHPITRTGIISSWATKYTETDQ
jgi:hypothetical protein